MSSCSLEEIRAIASDLSPGQSFSITKAELPSLPPEFEKTSLGTPLWIAHPGSTAQYRASPALHAYEMSDEWVFHRDQYDPHEDPVGHFFIDAPELPIATLFSTVAGAITYLILNRKEQSKPEEERNPWIPIGLAIAVAAIVWFVVYVLAALVRVAVGVG